MTAELHPGDDRGDSASSPEYICGYPTSRRDGGPCQRRVAYAADRCHHHPRTVLETTADTTGYNQ